jgi:hypothetical protein
MVDQKNMASWTRRHLSKIVIGAAGAVFLLGASTLGLGIATSSDEAPAAQVEATKGGLREDLTAAETALQEKHTTLMGQLGTVSVDRIAKDAATARSLALTLASSSASTLDARQQQAVLAARYAFLPAGSPVLTQFLPEWLEATTGQGSTTYQLTSLDQQVTGVQGLTYSYLAVARLDPVSTSSQNATEKPPQYMTLIYQTNADGAVLSLEFSRASDAARDALAK